MKYKDYGKLWFKFLNLFKSKESCLNLFVLIIIYKKFLKKLLKYP